VVNILHTIYQQVKQRPQQIAIESYKGDSINYVTLWREIEQLALELDSTCSEGTTIAIQQPKSARFIIQVLGCWLSGRACLIIDPNWPEERIKEITNQVKPEFMPTLQKQSSTKIHKDIPEFSVDSLAYIIFSSGSSGKPKGVLVPHNGLLSMLQEQIDMFQLEATSKNLWIHQVGFDASLSDIGTTLASGGTLCIPDPNLLLCPKTFSEQVELFSITHMDIPPALLSELKINAMPESLETIIIGGEVTTPRVIQKWAVNYRVVNVYGPTESTICSSMMLCSSNWKKNLIGPAMQHVEYRVLDPETKKPTNKGELYIYGDSVALGYLKQPHLTQQKFSIYNGQRCFKTGDLVERQSDGSIEYQGRSDRQFKANGCLICPEEIEVALLKLEGIQECHVSQINNCIHAWIVTSSDKTIASVKQGLSRSLPVWMIPQKIHKPDKLPRLDNLKLDAQQLYQSSDNNDLCKRLTDWMRQAIPDPNYQPDEDFYLAGGDSLAVLRFFNIAESHGVSLQHISLINSPSAHLLSKSIDTPSAYTMSTTVIQNHIKHELRKIQLCQTSKTPSCLKKTRILLTGATGFFGSALLGELLRASNTPVVCLVRGNPETQEKIILQKLKAHGYSEPKQKINLISGDISKEQLGQDSKSWKVLCNEPWTIVHSAAEVHLLKDFNALKNSNLCGTRRVLELLNTGVEKRLVYISTLSVFVESSPQPPLCQESDTLSSTEYVYGGYAQTKWAAERLIHQHERSLDQTQIIRLGLLTPNSKTGYTSDNDWFSHYLASSFKDYKEHQSMDFSPVDITAQLVVQLIQKATYKKVYHLANEEHLHYTTLANAMVQIDAPQSKINPYQSLQQSKQSNSNLTLFKTTSIEFCCENTKKSLATQLLFPKPNSDYLIPYLKKHLSL